MLTVGVIVAYGVLGLLFPVEMVLAISWIQKFYNTGFYKDIPVQRKDLRRGDHIYVPGNQSYAVKSASGSAGYFHHGIYMGDETIADFGRENKTHPVIASLNSFLQVKAGEDKYALYRRDHKNSLTVEATMKTIRRVVSAKAWEPYSLTRNNCEHFASMMKINKLWSGQGQIIEKPLYRQRYDDIIEKLTKTKVSNINQLS